ncbi:MAG: hypothetical protein ABIQ15_16235 [Nocardioides sp.]
MDSQMTDHRRSAPTMTWVEVADGAGGTRLEAHWSTPAHAVGTPQAA